MRSSILLVLLLLTLLVTPAHAPPTPNFYICSLYGQQNFNEAFLIDFKAGHIYQIAYAKEIDKVKVRRYKLSNVTQYNIRGTIEGKYLGDILGKHHYEDWPSDSPKTLLSLDRQQGFFVKLFTGYGDFYGPCKVSSEVIVKTADKLKEIGKRLKRDKQS